MATDGVVVSFNALGHMEEVSVQLPAQRPPKRSAKAPSKKKYALGWSYGVMDNLVLYAEDIPPRRKRSYSGNDAKRRPRNQRLFFYRPGASTSTYTGTSLVAPPLSPAPPLSRAPPLLPDWRVLKDVDWFGALPILCLFLSCLFFSQTVMDTYSWVTESLLFSHIAKPPTRSITDPVTIADASSYLTFFTWGLVSFLMIPILIAADVVKTVAVLAVTMVLGQTNVPTFITPAFVECVYESVQKYM